MHRQARRESRLLIARGPDTGTQVPSPRQSHGGGSATVAVKRAEPHSRVLGLHEVLDRLAIGDFRGRVGRGGLFKNTVMSRSDGPPPRSHPATPHARRSTSWPQTARGPCHAVTVHSNQSRPSGPVTATHFAPRQRLRADHSATKTRSSTRWRPARSAVLREAMLSPSIVPISRRVGSHSGLVAQAD